MLKKGTLAKVGAYYLQDGASSEEVSRALEEFFEVEAQTEDYEELICEGAEGYFNEWFMYDFILDNGNTILEDFVEKNPLGLSMNDMPLYEGLAKENLYGLFEVLRVDLGKGMVIKDLRTDKTFEVAEVKATFDTDPGYMLFSRVGKILDHYEFVGSDSIMLPETPQQLRMIVKALPEFTPKVAYMLASSRL